MTVPCPQGKDILSGSRGHAIKISEIISKAFEMSIDLESSLSPPETWAEFTKNTLNPLLDVEKRTYGGSKPTDTPEEDSDDQKEPKDDVRHIQKFSSFFRNLDNKEPEEQLE